MVYLYCITDARTKDLDNIDRVKARIIEYDSVSVVAAETGDFRPESPNNIMTHYKINDQILRNGFTVLPFAYGTIVSVDDVSSFVNGNIADIKQKIIEFRGKIEIGVKILVLIEKGQNKELIKLLSDTPGHRYLSQCLLKHAPFLAGRETVDALQRDFNKYLGPHYVRSKTKIHNRKNVLISNAFLVENSSLDCFLKAFEELKAMYPKCGFLVSGPWPAYNFINLRGYTPVGEVDSCGESYPGRGQWSV